MSNQFPDVSARYGAPMGRPDFVNNDTAEVHLFKVIFVDGDYDDGGAYWGGGPGTEALYCARDDEGEVQTFSRAESWDEAREMLLAAYPGLKIKREFDLALMLNGYLVCALWSSNDDEGPLDDRADVYDVSIEGLAQARSDCEDFCDLCDRAGIDLLTLPNMDESSIGHDFWLTRNGHGAGFWDRGLGEVGDKLSKLAHAYGECYADLRDDGKVDIT